MNARQRQMLRLAHSIHATIHRRLTNKPSFALPDSSWQRCGELSRRVQLASDRGWHTAADRVRTEFVQALRRCSDELLAGVGLLEELSQPRLSASVRDIYNDLLALDDEFDDVTWSDRKCLTVTTSSIVLEGIDLGRFDVELDWEELPDATYRVNALDANPAASNDCVTHPHVQDEALCEGEAKLPIRRALEEGRIADFYLIVANALATYNDSSPFVALRDWYGVSCADCDSTVSEDERRPCTNCDSGVCDDCYVRCQHCDDVFCSACSTTCEGCGDDHCKCCVQKCPQCDARVCPTCRREKGCENCDEETDDDDRSGTEAAAVTESPTEVHTVGVGETSLPA